MAWIFLITAGFCEVAMVTFMNLSENFTRWKPIIGLAIFGAVSFYLLSLAIVTLPLGVAYAIWTGIGSAGSVIVGMLFFKESRDLKRIVFISCIIISVVGLKFVTN
ncbi:DMT family transporter [Clostridium estertheticum]|uniref:Supressor protein SugE n=1 Tax=Clostridium estertheticum subsp. estertheticum TaxID=1552 RepID=A0A1J0GC32_9CLOT|nr:multidrug efflux SMR transporter [Clostridium estertheticum]APC38917.1 supressor protein SugE [Clostridium estertheticum subsp. estertheticum]MBZ9615134.1 multidrug efflux SMR transporter [Clostridium estertheticum subsp. laramiense]WAG75032.1 multidrug efflux SMR transporter [Clostridium estertheticum]